MKILFAVRSPGFFVRFFDGTVRDLSARGHALEVASHFGHGQDPERLSSADRATYDRLRRYELDLKEFRWTAARRRSDGWRRPLFASRKVLDYASYAAGGHQPSRMVVDRAKGFLPGPVRRALRFRLVQGLLTGAGFRRVLRGVERIAPPDPAITQVLRASRPDLVVASPVLIPGSDEIEYVKAAAKLGIPTLVAVQSWDNLTTKGMLPIIPDMTAVWNQAQVEEAVQIHRVPRDRVVFTGAPVFDEWFNLRPALERNAFCRQAGLDPERSYALYLCSSWSIAGNETAFVAQVARGLREQAGTRHLNLLVRPHPSNADIWKSHSSDSFKIWPPAGALPATENARQDFYDSLYHSVGALGINTSALIETAIADKPCITIFAERYRDTQQAIKHFQHLLNAEFLELAPNIPAAADILTAILQGQDLRHDRRQRFVEEFVRPWGVRRPASQMMATAIEAVGRRCSLDQIRGQLALEPASPQPASPPPDSEAGALLRKAVETPFAGPGR